MVGSRRTTILSCGLALLVSAGCDSSGYEDSTGALFEWQCSGGKCSVGNPLSALPELECPLGQASGYVAFWGRFVSVSGACDSGDGRWTAFEAWERPLACTADTDCPWLSSSRGDVTFECRSGLCQSADTITYPAAVVVRSDARLLCYGAVARGETTSILEDAQVVALVDQACPGTESRSVCELPLPAECIQP